MSEILLDAPEITRVLFYPRREYPGPLPSGVRAVSVEVEPGIKIGGRLYPAATGSPLIIYWHGNGEIAADYDDIAPIYNQLDISLLVFDYRGYGTSTGSPTASTLLTDAFTLFQSSGIILEQQGLKPVRIYVMGRSLGSAPAIEVAQRAPEKLSGLIIESGFAHTFRLLARLGTWIPNADEERDGAGNARKIAQIELPTLILHGADDALILPSEGRALYKCSAAQDKRLVLIPNAGHNDIMVVGVEQYFSAIRDLIHTGK